MNHFWFAARLGVNYFFALGLFGCNEEKKHPEEIVVTHGRSEQIMKDLSDAGSVIAVNITDVIARLPPVPM